MTKIRTTLFVILISASFASMAFGQTFVTPFSYPGGARATALSNTYINDVLDPVSLYWNPAAIMYIQSVGPSVNHLDNTTAGYQQDNLSVPVFLSDQFGIAAGGTITQRNYLQKTQFPKFMEVSASVGFAMEFYKGFSLGATFNGFSGKSGTPPSITTGSAVIGMYYSPYPEISYALVYEGFGDRIAYQVDSLSRFTIQKNKTHQILKLGLRMRYINPRTREPIIVLSIGNEKVFGVSGLIYRGGLEGYVFPWFALLGGYSITTPAQRGGGTIGASFTVGPVRIDGGLSPTRNPERVYQLSVSVAP